MYRSIRRGVGQIMCLYKCIHMLGELTCCSYDLLAFQSDDTVNQKDGFEKKQTWCCQTQHLFEGLSLKPVHGRFSDICCCCSLESFSLTFIHALEMSFSTDGKQWWNFQLWSKELKSFTLFSTASWPCHTHNFESWEHVTNRNITTTCSIVAQV